MVRLKNRYILFEVLYPPSSVPSGHEERVKFHAFASSPRDCLVNLHSSSQASINPRTLSALLKKVVTDHYGELAAGTVGQLILVKYFSNKTSTGIIRCSRADFHLVVGALALVTKVETRQVVLRCVHVSGTIRKCEDFAIKRSRQLITDLGKESEPAHGLYDLVCMIQADETGV